MLRFIYRVFYTEWLFLWARVRSYLVVAAHSIAEGLVRHDLCLPIQEGQEVILHRLQLLLIKLRAKERNNIKTKQYYLKSYFYLIFTSTKDLINLFLYNFFFLVIVVLDFVLFKPWSTRWQKTSSAWNAFERNEIIGFRHLFSLFCRIVLLDNQFNRVLMEWCLYVTDTAISRIHFPETNQSQQRSPKTVRQQFQKHHQSISFLFRDSLMITIVWNAFANMFSFNKQENPQKLSLSRSAIAYVWGTRQSIWKMKPFFPPLTVALQATKT